MNLPEPPKHNPSAAGTSEPSVPASPVLIENLRDLAERELSLLATLIEYLPVAAYMGDFSGITVCNRVGLALLGFDTLTELPCNVVVLSEQIQMRSSETGVRLLSEEEPFARALLGEACTREVAYTHRKTGEEIVVECAAVPIREQGKIVAALVVCIDITARKRAEAALRKSEEELQISRKSLLNEICATPHYVKNHLQILDFLIDMTVMGYEGEQAVPAKEVFYLKSQVRALALIHDLLSQKVKETRDLQCVSAKAVVEDLLLTLDRRARKQTVCGTLEEVELNARQCSALALILIELLSHTFSSSEKEASVALTVDSYTVTLTVYGEGPDFPDGFDPEKASHFGLNLIESLARLDLKGQTSYRNRPEGGGEVRITFPLTEKW